MLFKSGKAVKKKISDWQHWPFYLFYLPITHIWLGYYLKARSLWFYTASNPTITFGGFEGEAKSEIYKQLPAARYPVSIYVNPLTSFTETIEQVKSASIQFPFVVKPDVGMKGLLFRKIENEQQLKKYNDNISCIYIVQEYIDLPCEVSVFYCRKPSENKGFITAMIEKKLLEIIGDGRSTIEQLIENNSEAKPFLSTLKRQQLKSLSTVLREKEKFIISPVANLYNGAQFVDFTDKVNEKLLQTFDTISHNSNFLYGRYDIKCNSIDAFLQGEKFVVLEFNGAGSVPNHIYAGKFTLLQAYKEILKHWKLLYEISRDNHNKGISYWSFLKGYRFLQQSKKHFNKLKQLDKELDLNAL